MATVKRSKRRPPPPSQKMSRLARIKLDGGAHWKAMARDRKSRPRGTALYGALLVGGAALAGAAWIGGSLFDTREAMYAGADSLATAAGLKAHIDVRGVEGQRKREVEAVVLPQGRVSILAASPEVMKDNVESLDWVARARVARLWPSTIRVTVARRDAFALWQEDNQITVVDAAGERVHGARVADYASLPRIVGHGAGPAAEPVLTALEDLPELRKRLVAFVRVSDRRWNVTLRSGMVVMLPEAGEVVALRRLEQLQQRYGVLDRAYARIDVRDDGRLVVQPRVAPSVQAASVQTARGA